VRDWWWRDVDEVERERESNSEKQKNWIRVKKIKVSILLLTAKLQKGCVTLEGLCNKKTEEGIKLVEYYGTYVLLY
jgi:hypothetical protein